MTEQPAGGDLSRLRQLNALTVINLLRNDEALTLSDLARRSGLSRPSTEDVVRGLMNQGWLLSVAPASGSVGRPANRYRFRAEAGHLLGVDIGVHKVLAVVTDLSAHVLHSTRLPVDADAGRRERLTAVDAAVEQSLSATSLTGADIWATGVATTGLVDAAGRVLLSVANPEWTGVRLAENVARQVAGPVLVENDMKMAALAESRLGVARHAKDVVFILAGLRTGTGLIIDGRLHRGFSNAAGEIGALPAIGWIRAQEHLQNWSGLPADVAPDEAAALVFSSARAGNRSAKSAVRRYVKDLALGAAALVLTLDPELVVFGGGFSRSADVLLEPFRHELDMLCIRTPEVVTSTLGDESVALGATILALNHVEKKVFDSNLGLMPAAAPGR